jgi:hypothetical protein
MEKVFRFIILAFLVCFLFGCSNFATQKRSNFQKIASLLDYDGTSLSINTNTELNNTLYTYKTLLEKQIAYSNTIDSLSKRQLQALISSLEYLALASGVADIKGMGSSSKKFGEFYYNKGFLLVDPKSKGFLWDLVGKENLQLGKFVESLPADDTYMAGEAVIKLSSTFEKLKQYSLNSSETFKLLQPIITYQLDQLIACLDGVWQFAILNSDDYEFILSVPDKEQKVFNFISLITNSSEKKPKDGIIEIKNFFDENISLFISSKKLVDVKTKQTSYRVIFTTYKDYISLPINSKKMVKDLASYQSYTKNINKNSIAYFYVADKVKNLIGSELKIKNITLDLAFLHYGQVASISCTKDGFYLLQKSKLDWSSGFMSNFAYVSALFFEMIADDVIKALPKDFLSQLTLIGSEEPIKQEEKNLVSNKNKNKYCQDNLGRLGVLINNHIKKQGKMFKDYQDLLKNIPESKELFACPQDTTKRYVYLGPYDKNSNGKLPVVIDQPFSHKDSFNVLYLDGTVECLEIEDCKSFRRMISFLHTKNFYSEEDFILLIKRATALDELWKLE